MTLSHRSWQMNGADVGAARHPRCTSKNLTSPMIDKSLEDTYVAHSTIHER